MHWRGGTQSISMLLIPSVLAVATCVRAASVLGEFDDVVVDFILDATPSLFPPVRVCFYWCANEEQIVKLSKEMSKRYLTHNIRSILEGFDGRFCDDGVEHQTLNVLNLDCPHANDVLEKANSSYMFRSPKKWLLFRDEVEIYSSIGVKGTDDFVLETFDEFTTYPDSDVVLAQRSENNFFSLTALYRPSPYRGVILEDRGNWTVSHGIRKRNHDVASRRRRNLHLTPLKSCLAMTHPDTINHLTDYHDNHVDPTTKANYPWVLHLASRLNATVSFNISNSWGYRDKNGSWNGMIGMLQRREIDVGGTSTFLIAQRIDIVEYIQLYTYTGSRFVFKKPLLSTVSNIFTLPFQRSVWIAIASFLVLVFCLLYLSMKWEFSQGASDKSGTYWAEMNASEPTVGDDFLILLGAVAQQGYAYEPYRVPSRIVTFMLLIAALSLYAAYTANIVALLQSTTDSINTLTDLINSPLKLGAHNVSYNRYYFKSFQDPVRQAISQKIEPNGKKSSWMTIEDGVQKIREGLFAFHAELGTMYKIMQDTYQEDEKCGLTEIDYLHVLSPMFVIQKQSPYLEIVKNWALLMRESGLKFRDEYRLFTNKPTCHGQTSFITIGLTECNFALVTMGSGILLSVLMLSLETLWFRSLSILAGDTAKIHLHCAKFFTLFFHWSLLYRYKPTTNMTIENLIIKRYAD